jgi:hypothetical protein
LALRTSTPPSTTLSSMLPISLAVRPSPVSPVRLPFSSTQIS